MGAWPAWDSFLREKLPVMNRGAEISKPDSTTAKVSLSSVQTPKGKHTKMWVFGCHGQQAARAYWVHWRTSCQWHPNSQCLFQLHILLWLLYSDLLHTSASAKRADWTSGLFHHNTPYREGTVMTAVDHKYGSASGHLSQRVFSRPRADGLILRSREEVV